MGWFRKLLGLDEPPAPEVEIEAQHVEFDPLDRTEVDILVQVRFRDGRDMERREVIQRNQIEELAQELIDDLDIREAAIYEEVAHHHKSFVGDRDAQLISTGAIIGANAAAGMGRGV